jgi:putative peptidoglycan lipid II flippase
LWNSVTLVDNFFVSQMPSGNTTALNYARRILTMLSVILVGSVYTISVPEISKLVNQNQYPELKSLLVKRMSQSALVLLPFVGLMLCFSEQFVQLAFERGKFDHQATILTAAALRMYMIGIIPFACIRFVYQAFNALGKTYMNTCIFTGIFLGSVILNTLLFHLGITGIALSTSLDFSVAFLVSAVLLFRYLEYQHQSRRLLVPESQFQHPGDEDQESA